MLQEMSARPFDVRVTKPSSIGPPQNGQPAASPGNVDMGNMMKDAGSGRYLFNLDTKPYPAGPGSSPIKISITAKSPDDRSGALDVMVSLD